MPNASIEVVEGPMDRLFQQLKQREIDVARTAASVKTDQIGAAERLLQHVGQAASVGNDRRGRGNDRYVCGVQASATTGAALRVDGGVVRAIA